MEFLPRSMGTRPRLACEVRAEGVVAARAEDATAVLQAVARVPLTDGTGMPQMRASDAGGAAAGAVAAGVSGSAAGRATMVAALRKALEEVCQRTREVTLVVPDAAVRVLLLDFDTLPAKEVEALPVVRFRLKKLLPFDADDAAVSYQVMATTRDGLQVLAVAMPREVQEEYESLVREAGFEPGAILPSTLAALAGLDEGAMATLVVNAGRDAVTTAIVKSGVLLLHRTVDLGGGSNAAVTATAPATAAAAVVSAAAQEQPADTSIAAIAARLKAVGAPAGAAPAPAPPAEPAPVAESSADAGTNEVGQAVSVAAAYFEDTLETPPSVVLSAGTLGAEALTAVLDDSRVGIGMGPVAVQEMVSRQALGEGAGSAGLYGGVPLGWLAGVRGGVGELMRISVNLATRPFVELRPVFARLRLLMAGLALLAVALGITLHTLNKHAQVAEAQMDALKAQTQALEMERQTNEARMREPQNRSVLERSQFLNTMFAAKSFSWTAVMMDLEGVLPGGVQVTSIEPSITAERDINIRLRVSGPRDLEVDLVRNLEKSQRFLHPRLAAESSQLSEQGKVVQAAQTGVPGGVEFDIHSGYIPLPADLMKWSAGGKANEGKPAAASAKAGGNAAAALPGTARPAQSRSATPGTAGTPGAVKKPAKAAAPGVIH